MFDIPLVALLGVYAVGVLIALILSVFALYHLWAYGATRRMAVAATLVFLLGLTILLGGTWWLLRDVNWQMPLSIESIEPPTFDLPSL